METDLTPAELLAVLHDVEEQFGRVRRERNEARVLDLDLLAFNDRVSAPGETPILPHPRMGERAFVLLPLSEVAPTWRHPVNGLSAADSRRSQSDCGDARSFVLWRGAGRIPLGIGADSGIRRHSARTESDVLHHTAIR